MRAQNHLYYYHRRIQLRPKSRVVKLPVIYVGGKLPVTYRPLLARMGHRALVLKGVGQSLGLMTVIITR